MTQGEKRGQAAGFREIAAGMALFAAGILLAIFLGAHSWIAGVRWAGLVVLAVAGLRRQSLTYWIFFAMLLGGEIGADCPQFAEHLRLLSDIFLRLIKVIVAPLISGDAHHGNCGPQEFEKRGAHWRQMPDLL